MGTISVRSDIKKFASALEDRAKRQVPFAVKEALNATMRQAQDGYRRDVASVFDRPTPWTINATFIRFASRDSLEASIQFKDRGSGTPAGKFLGPEILGGPRRVKRFERPFASLGIGADIETVPGKGAQLDAYGNISRAQIRRILENLKLREKRRKTPPRKAHDAPDTRLHVGDYYLAKGRDGRPLGIYQLAAPGRVVPILIFVRRAPEYRRRFDFYGMLEVSYRRNFGENLRRCMAEAMKTAR